MPWRESDAMDQRLQFVTDARTFRFRQRLLYIANALVNQHIGLEETDAGVWAIYFNTVLLATLDERDFVHDEDHETEHPTGDAPPRCWNWP